MVAVSLKKKKKKKKKKKNIIFFFFKQKTAYEMCDSDWSSDVCSSDLSGLECLVLKKGRAKLYIYDTDSGAVIERELRALDTVLLYDCGHRLDYLEDTVLIELKLGPRRVSGDKVLL